MAPIDSNEWRERSKRGEICGVIGCSNNATTQCPKCLNHYCYEHLQIHVHPLTDQEVANDRNRNEKLRSFIKR